MGGGEHDGVAHCGLLRIGTEGHQLCDQPRHVLPGRAEQRVKARSRRVWREACPHSDQANSEAGVARFADRHLERGRRGSAVAVRVCAVPNEGLGDLRIACCGGVAEGCRAVVIGGVHGGPGVDQTACEGGRLLLDCKHEGRLVIESPKPDGARQGNCRLKC